MSRTRSQRSYALTNASCARSSAPTASPATITSARATDRYSARKKSSKVTGETSVSGSARVFTNSITRGSAGTFGSEIESFKGASSWPTAVVVVEGRHLRGGGRAERPVVERQLAADPL